MKKKVLPLISVVVTNYNYGKYLYDSLESVLSQTYKNMEIILIDDCSTDNSKKIYKEYKNRIKVIKHKKNYGIVYSRNEALKIVKGEFICFLDADDFWDNDYLEKMSDVANKSNADVIYPNWRMFGDEEYTTDFSEFNTQDLIRQKIHCTVESLIRLKNIGKNKFESQKIAEDWDFFLGLALSEKKIKLAKDCFINYRLHGRTRGNRHDFITGQQLFVNILWKWYKRYPDKVDPASLPLCVSEKLYNRIHELTRELENTVNSRDDKAKQIDMILESRSYKIGRLITSPIGVFRKKR